MIIKINKYKINNIYDLKKNILLFSYLVKITCYLDKVTPKTDLKHFLILMKAVSYVHVKNKAKMP